MTPVHVGYGWPDRLHVTPSAKDPTCIEIRVASDILAHEKRMQPVWVRARRGTDAVLSIGENTYAARPAAGSGGDIRGHGRTGQ